jgi:hypothetical protein
MTDEPKSQNALRNMLIHSPQKEITLDQWERFAADLRALASGMEAPSDTEAKQKQAEQAESAAKDVPRMQAPAVYVDKFHTVYWKGHVRLALGERSPYDQTYWRYSILLETKDVERLIEQLQSSLKKAQPEEGGGDEGK